MSGRPPRKGKHSQATKRGQAGSVSTANSAGRGHGASSARGRGARLSFFSTAGCIEPQHAEELVEWITKLSSSSVTQAKTSLAANAVAKAAYSIGSMASESPELFDHGVGYMLQEDVQHFECSNDGTQVEDEGSNVSPERGGAQEGQETGSHVPPAAAYCQVFSSGEEGGDDEVTDSTWVPDRREEEEEAHLQRDRMLSRGQLKDSQPMHHTAELCVCRALLTSHVFSKVLWCAADRTVAVCNICLKRIKRGQNSSHLSTTFLTRHMSSSHTVHWQQYLKDPHQRTRRTSPCSSSAGISNPTIPSFLSETCTERNEGVELGFPSTCGQTASGTPKSNCSRHISLPQLLNRRKKFGPSHPHAQWLNASLAKFLALQLLP
ncbi:hypothetical protein AB205_0027010, partial [Aquarana catesbeiana]